MSRSNPASEDARQKAKHQVGILLRWNHRITMGIVLSFLGCLAYVVLALINGWQLSVGMIPAWCTAPCFVCLTPFLVFVLATLHRPTPRAGALARTFNDDTEIQHLLNEICEKIRTDEGLATPEDLAALEDLLNQLAKDMEKALSLGADRYEIFHYVEMSLQRELGAHGVENHDLRRRVLEFIEANRI